MKQTPERVSADYHGYQILLSVTVAVAILAEVFTFTILMVLRTVCVFLVISFLLGIHISIDKLKLAGWKKRKRWQRLFLIPMCGLLITLPWATIPIAAKSLLAAISIYIILLLTKPQKQEKQ